MTTRLTCLLLLLAVHWPSASATAQSSDWQLRLNDDVGLEVLCHSAPVVSMRYNFWDRGWKYADSQLRLGPGRTFNGQVNRLGISIAGRIQAIKPNVLRVTYMLKIKQAKEGLIGGGPEFSLQLDSPALAGAGEPVLLENQLGWRWPMGDDALEVRFDQPAASVYFEKGQKHRIRTYFVGENIQAGARKIVMTITLPRSGTMAPSLTERYGQTDIENWPISPLDLTASPVDLRYLNREDRPAGRRGFVRAQGDQLVFEDGTGARFWGTNIAAYALFAPKKQIKRQASRIAALGFNLVRLHHHDSTQWVKPTVIDQSRNDSQHLDQNAMAHLHWWIQCLKEQGVYVWIDLHVARQFKIGDAIGAGYDEIKKQNGGETKGFCYLNGRVQVLMQKFNSDYLNHKSPYSGLAIKDDPAVVGMLITNENDLTHHFGHLFHPEKMNPQHQAVYDQAMQDYANRTHLPIEQLRLTWQPGPGMLFLNELEHRFNRTMLDHLTKAGVRVPAATTNAWGQMKVASLPALNDGGLIDVHTYGREDSLSADPRYASNFMTWIATAHVHDKPLTISEWSVPYPTSDRFIAPMYMAAIASLQGWDGPMFYNYSQRHFGRPSRAYPWSSFSDPAITALMPAAALAFRRGDISPAKRNICLKLSEQQVFHEGLGPQTSATIRTLVEQSRITLGLPDAKHLDWDSASQVENAQIITDPHRSFIASDAHEVVSDTGELRRNWLKGMQTIDTPRTAAAQGWLGGQEIDLTHLSLRLQTPKAAVVVTSLDDKPIDQSHRLLMTVVARVLPIAGKHMPYRCQPVRGEIAIKSNVSGLNLFSLRGNGKTGAPMQPEYKDGAYRFKLATPQWSLWYVLEEGVRG